MAGAKNSPRPTSPERIVVGSDSANRSGVWATSAPLPEHVPTKLVQGLLATVATLALVTLLKLRFVDYMGTGTPFLLYFGAVLVAAWFGGWGLGLLATAASALLGYGYFLPPVDIHHVWPLSIRPLIQVALFCLEGVTITAITNRLRGTRQRSLLAAKEAHLSLAKLSAVLEGVDDGITVQDRTGRLVFANGRAARLIGFDTPEDLLAAPVAEIMSRFELFDQKGDPLSAADLPGRAVLQGQAGAERVVRFRAKPTGEDRWALVRSGGVRDADGTVLHAVNVFHDVTEKRRHEEALRVSQEWFSMALRSVGDAVIATDRSGLVTFMNPIAEQLTGWKSHEAVNHSLDQVFHIVNEETRQPVDNPVERVIREGVAVGLANHTVLIGRDGSERAIDDSAAPIRDGEGALVGTVLVFRDVSQKRREEQQRNFIARATAELSASLDYDKALATVARLAIPAVADWCAVDVVDEAGGRHRLAVAHVDPAKLKFVQELELRYPPDPNASTGVPHILRTGETEILPDIPAAVIEAAARDAEHLQLIQTLQLRSYIGVPIKIRERTVGAISLVMAESNRRYTTEDLAIAKALADRAAVAIENAWLFRAVEQARNEGQDQRDRLRALIMNAPAAIAIHSGPDHVFELVNEPYRAIYGGRDLVGQPLSAIGLSPAERAILDQVRATGVPATSVEYPVDGLGGHTRYFNFQVQPLRSGRGSGDSLVTFAIEVTDEVVARKRIESARAEAELANRSKDEFLAMLGHELRNPLAPILTALHIMKLRAGETFTHERTIIERQVKHLVRLVDDLLDVSRITRGKVDLSKESVELSDVVAKAIEIASPLIEQREHALDVAVPHGLLVAGDVGRLAQVVANLLTNAAKYTEKSGRIEVLGERQGDSVMLRVRDNGIGIAAEMLPRVFELFTQEQQAIDRAQGGLGLGLAIVRSLVQMHGGSVSAHSAGLGQGSEFRIVLPALAAQPAAADPTAERSASVQPGVRATRVLIVDDNEDAREMLGEALQLAGYETYLAADGPSALVLAAQVKPAIGLLDIGLPVMDGFELARRLREQPELASIRLVAVTGYGQASDRERTQAAGFDAHLVKPISIDTVTSTVDKLIG